MRWGTSNARVTVASVCSNKGSDSDFATLQFSILVL